MPDLATWRRRHESLLRARRWRGVLWIAGDIECAVAKALQWIETGDWLAPLWVGQRPQSLESAIPSLAHARVRSRLGAEHDLVVFDVVGSGNGFDPDAFGAVSGTVVAGGWLVLLTPAHWLQPEPGAWRADADYRRLAHWPHEIDTLDARYLARLARHLRGFSALSRWSAGGTERPIAPVLPTLSEPAESTPGAVDPDCLTADQADAVARLVRLRRRRPLVLVADRGRGKSAALGIAAARRLQQGLGGGESRLWVTSPSPASVESLFERLAALLPAGSREENRFDITLGRRACRVEWLPPEAVLPALDSGEVDPRSPPTLWVDEAASIPTARLALWLRRFPRLAFATTVHGYEGTGRGFEVRLRERLDRWTPDWRRLHLNTPVRWNAGDPLETLTRRLLCLDADITEPTRVEAALEEAAVDYAWLDRAALAEDDTWLTQVFGLLVQAHYRTAPSDLRQLLDGPDLRLLAARVDGIVIGLCAVQQEGGFGSDLADAIHLGRRRPRGHLLAQSLATHGGFVEAARARWWRVMRIAVHPAARRRGIGAALVERVASAAREHAVERLGASFGAEPALVRFWREQGFHSLRIGLTREPASGEPALMMGRGLTPNARRMIAEMADVFERLLPDLLAGELGDIEPTTAAVLLHEGAIPEIPDEIAVRLAWFAGGGGELALVRPWLRQAWLAWWRSRPLEDLSDIGEPTAVTGAGELDDIANIVVMVATLFQYRDAPLSNAGRHERQAASRSLATALHDWARAQADAPHMVKPQPDE